MGEVKSARQKDEEAKLRAEVQNVPGWHRKPKTEDCDGCEEKRKKRTKKQAEEKTSVPSAENGG